MLASLTKWDDIYHRLCASDFNDGRWEAHSFGMQKVDDVKKALQWLENHDLQKYNISSISTAKLATLVLGALGGKNTKANVNDYLPFDTRRIKKDRGVSSGSLAVLRQLMKTRRMNGRVIALLADELKMASQREE